MASYGRRQTNISIKRDPHAVGKRDGPAASSVVAVGDLASSG